MGFVDQTLDDYGRGVGLDDLRFNEQGVASLHFEEMGTLLVERLEDAVLVYLIREIERPNSEVYARALELCHWDHNPPYLVNVALRHEGYLAFSVRLDQTEFSLPTIERVVALLDSFHTQAIEGVVA